MKKKGVEMSLNVIIVAAIGLLILVILAFLVVNYINKTRTEGLESCTTRGGLCQTSCTAGNEITPGAGLTAFKDCTKKCCKVVPTG